MSRRKPDKGGFVSRGGRKLDHALDAFGIDIAGLTCADFGCSTGGFTDCLLQRGAARVFAVDTGYGVLDWKLRNDERVTVMERTNALHVELPEPVDLITIDASWTRQRLILATAARNLTASGQVVTLVKPHYEADKSLLFKGRLPEAHLDQVLTAVREDVAGAGFTIIGETPSPITGGSGGNVEHFLACRLT
ncbi:MAG: SAM-dependent methyltransferase [Planctomycetota bacterium]